MSDTAICLLVRMPYQKKETLISLPENCLIQTALKHLSDIYPAKSDQPQAVYFYFAEEDRLLCSDKTFSEENITDGAVLFWI